MQHRIYDLLRSEYIVNPLASKDGLGGQMQKKGRGQIMKILIHGVYIPYLNITVDFFIFTSIFTSPKKTGERAKPMIIKFSLCKFKKIRCCKNLRGGGHTDPWCL